MSSFAKRGKLDLTRFVNAADISAADMPHIVVEKLQRSIDAAPLDDEGNPSIGDYSHSGSDPADAARENTKAVKEE